MKGQPNQRDAGRSIALGLKEDYGQRTPYNDEERVQMLPIPHDVPAAYRTVHNTRILRTCDMFSRRKPTRERATCYNLTQSKYVLGDFLVSSRM